MTPVEVVPAHLCEEEHSLVGEVVDSNVNKPRVA
jgi:hypothetical protein